MGQEHPPSSAATCGWTCCGAAMVFVVVDHIEPPSLWYLVSKKRVGLVTGAEVFVAVSGVVLGLVHRHRSIEAGWRSSVGALLRRSGKLYVTSVVVILIVFALRLVPRFHDEPLATYTGPTGVVFDLYPGSADLLTLLDGVALLRYGPGQFNIVGLYVVLLALTPVALWLLLSAGGGSCSPPAPEATRQRRPASGA